MKSFKTILLLTLVTTSFLMNSCGVLVKAKARKSITEENGAIPPDLGKENTTMIFFLYHRSYNRYLKKNAKKFYKDDYIFLTEEEFTKNETYRDISKYRYIFKFDYIHYTVPDFNSPSFEKRRRVKKFYIVDRKTGITYKSKMTSGLWSKLQKVYFEKLSEKITSNRR
ncbi:hypothetical protein [Kordia sp.]|uniref:hypothetical protein n=1 Tax=Kordia sp. TaxID=1965332 RepID=UPI003B5CCC29